MDKGDIEPIFTTDPIERNGSRVLLPHTSSGTATLLHACRDEESDTQCGFAFIDEIVIDAVNHGTVVETVYTSIGDGGIFVGVVLQPGMPPIEVNRGRITGGWHVYGYASTTNIVSVNLKMDRLQIGEVT